MHVPKIIAICLKLLFTCRCLHALPEEQANEVALQLASAPAASTGSSQSVLLAVLQEREPGLSGEQQRNLEAIRLSLHLPQPWQDRLRHLLGECCMKQSCNCGNQGVPSTRLHGLSACLLSAWGTP